MRISKDKIEKQPSLEEFSKANRSAFDELEAVDKVGLWNAIQSELPGKLRPISGWRLEMGTYWKWSAAACIAFAILFGVYYNTSQNQNSTVADIAIFYPDLKPTQVRYQRMIAQKEAGLKLSEIDQEEYADIFYELKILDEIYAELLVELPSFSDQEKVKEILLRYYERKLKTLEILSKEIQRQQKYKRYEEEDQLI